jgi:hypothetical protein|tara:strand:- start:5758 stop:6270 length:513 start_codon:yes stop_codon:yes gene_type:complete
MSDWWIVKNNFDYNIIKKEFESQDIEWLDNIGTNHGTKWCRISLFQDTIKYIEKFIGVSIVTSEMYVWDYGTRKDLPMHIDTHDWNSGNWIAVAIPFIGVFHLEAFDQSRTEKLDEVDYGPGDVLILNNRKYPHQGHVINETRVAFHCYLKTPNYDIRKTLEENIREHKL